MADVLFVHLPGMSCEAQAIKTQIKEYTCGFTRLNQGRVFMWTQQNYIGKLDV